MADTTTKPKTLRKTSKKRQDPHGLTWRQRLFVKGFVKCFNATQAYKDAGFKDSESASRLIGKVNVQEAIQDEMARMTENVEVTQEDVLRMLKNEAEGKIDVPGSTNSQSARVTAISLLGKYHGMFIDNTNISHTDLDSRMQKANERIAARKAASSEQDDQDHPDDSEQSDEHPQPLKNVINGEF